MANFILVSPSSGSGNVVIKVKPVNENTSTTVEKKGKLIIRVNGEIQKTIPLTQNIKSSSGGGGGGGTTTTKTLTSREISLDIYSGSYPDPSGLKCLNTNAEGGVKSNKWYLRPVYNYNTSNSKYKIIIPYSVSAKQTDYFSDGTEEYTNLLPEFKWNDTEDNSGTMKDWDYTYSGDSKATSETDNEVEVQSSNDTPVLAGYLLHIRSKVGMGELNILNKIYANFKVESKHRTDVADTLVTSTIQVDINWTITVSDNTGLLTPNPDLNKPIQ